MDYRTVGKTGFRLSRLGFGAMRLPMLGEGPESRIDRSLAIPMIHRAFEAGVNYIDTAVGYCNSDSQNVVGEALRGWRDRITVSTKNHDFGQDEKTWWGLLEDSLRKLGVDAIDVYNHHGVNEQNFFGDVLPRLGRWMAKAKDQGLVKHICVSFHDGNEALRKIVDSGYPEIITLQYNILDRQLEDGIAHAHEKGVGVVVMGPVGGGRLGAPSEVLESLVPGIRRVPELALRFVLANPDVDVTISGMSTMEQVEENLRTAEDPVALTPADRAAIHEHLERLKKMADLYCTGCGYCLPCPEGVDIPAVFARYNQGRVYGMWDVARDAYDRMIAERRENRLPASECAECRTCEPKCPQHIAICDQLKEAHARLLRHPA